MSKCIQLAMLSNVYMFKSKTSTIPKCFQEKNRLMVCMFLVNILWLFVSWFVLEYLWCKRDRQGGKGALDRRACARFCWFPITLNVFFFFEILMTKQNFRLKFLNGKLHQNLKNQRFSIKRFMSILTSYTKTDWQASTTPSNKITICWKNLRKIVYSIFLVYYGNP